MIKKHHLAFLIGWSYLCSIPTAQGQLFHKIIKQQASPYGVVTDAVQVAGIGYRGIGQADTSIFLLTTDADFKPLQARRYHYDETYLSVQGPDYFQETNQNIYPNTILQASGGGYWLGGTVDSSGATTYSNGVTVSGNVRTHGFLARTAADGTLLWAKKYVGADDRDLVFSAIIALPDQRIVALGSYRHPLTVDRFAAIFVMDAGGNPLACWADNHNNYSELSTGVLTTEGKLVVCGRYSNAGGPYRAFVCQLTPDLSPIWTKSYRQVAFDNALDLAALPGGGVGIVAYIGANDSHTVVIKTDAYGNELFVKRIGEQPTDYPIAIQALPDGGFAVASDISDYSQSDMDVFRLDAQGEVLWSRRIGQDSIIVQNQGETIVKYNESANTLLLKGDQLLLLGSRGILQDSADIKRHVLYATFASSLSMAGETADCLTRDPQMQSADATDIIIENKISSFGLLPVIQQNMDMTQSGDIFTENVLCDKPLATFGLPNTAKNLALSPNPADDIVRIELPAGDFQIKIWDAAGRCVQATALTDRTFSVKHLPTGTYWLEVFDVGNGLFGNGVFVKAL